MFRTLGNIWGDVDQFVDPTTYYNFYDYSLRFAASGHVNRAALQIEYRQE